MANLSIITAKKEALFAQINDVYNLTLKISDKGIAQKLIIKSNSINRLRQEFSDILDAYNELAMKEDVKFTPNYAPLSAVDDMVDQVIHTATILQAKQAVKQSPATSLPATIQCPLKLPKLELKRFNGDPIEWVSFINLFNSAIHENNTLTPVAKLQYLLSVLSNEPFNLIKSLPISDKNYEVAYNILKERYHSQRRLTSLHLNKILDLPTIHHMAKQMCNFITIYSKNTENLKGLNIDITTNNSLLSAMLLRKMDSIL
uniref:Uncharacterized protein n=1 Tax=Clastoptera arizonana TaxID=38151 RepID=A0A1B6DSA7_9HEMI